MHKTMSYYIESGVERVNDILDVLDVVGDKMSTTFAPTTNPDLADMIIFPDKDQKMIAGKYYGTGKLLVSDFWLTA